MSKFILRKINLFLKEKKSKIIFYASFRKLRFYNVKLGISIIFWNNLFLKMYFRKFCAEGDLVCLLESESIEELFTTDNIQMITYSLGSRCDDLEIHFELRRPSADEIIEVAIFVCDLDGRTVYKKYNIKINGEPLKDDDEYYTFNYFYGDVEHEGAITVSIDRKFEKTFDMETDVVPFLDESGVMRYHLGDKFYNKTLLFKPSSIGGVEIYFDGDNTEFEMWVDNDVVFPDGENFILEHPLWGRFDMTITKI